MMDASDTQQPADNIGPILDRIRHKLLDLTLRNKLLSYRERTRSIRIVDELPDTVFHDLVEARRRFEFRSAEDDDGDIDLSHDLPATPAEPDAVAPKHQDRFLQTTLASDMLTKRLRQLAAEARRAIEETGYNTLYLAFGFLEWVDSTSGKVAKAPLILLPVSLRRTRLRRGSTLGYRYQLFSNEEDLEDNLSLAEKLLREFGLVLPSLYEDDEPLEPEDFFARVTAAVTDREGWRVARELVLDLFSFSKLFLYRDLDSRRWPTDKAPADNPQVRDLVLGSGDVTLDANPDVYAIDSHPVAAELPLLFDADSAQISAVIDALEGRNMVLEGPPGTGKSQTICNLIGAFLAAGKSVLFLAEKQAALQVVKARLDQRDLGPFVLELHSSETNKRQLLANLRLRLEHRSSRSKTRQEVRKQRDDLRDELNRQAEENNRPVADSSLTVHEVFWQLERCRGLTPDLTPLALPAAATWNRNEVQRRLDLASELGAHLSDRSPRDNCWYGFYPTSLNAASRPQLAQDMDQVHDLLSDLLQQLAPLEELAGSKLEGSFASLQQLAGVDRSVLTRQPADFDQRIASQCAGQATSPKIRGLVDRLDAIKGFRKSASRSLRDLEERDDQELAGWRKTLERADRYGLLKLPYGALGEAASVLQRICDRLTQLQEMLGAHLALGYELPHTFSELATLEHCLAFASDETPVEASLYLRDTLFRGDVLSLVRRARAVAEKQLRDDGQRLAAEVAIERSPGLAELRRLLDILDAPRSFFGRLSNEYLQALRSWRRVEHESRKIRESVKLLRSLIEFFEKREAFKHSLEFQQGLDWIFDGFDTPWDQAERIADWADTVVRLAPSRQFVERLRESFDATLAECRELRTAARHVLDELPVLAARLNGLLAGSGSDLGELDVGDDASLFSSLARLDHARDLLLALAEPLELAVVSRTSELGELQTALDLENRARRAILDLQDIDEHVRFHFGDAWASEATEIGPYLALFQWHDQLLAAGVPAAVVRWQMSADTLERSDQLCVMLDSLRTGDKTITQIETLLGAYGHLEVDRFFTAGGEPLTLPELLAKVDECRADLDGALGWADFCRACADADDLGLGSLVEMLDAGRCPGSQAADAFKLSYFAAMAGFVIDRHPELDDFNRGRHAVATERFRELDRACQAIDKQQVVRQVKKRRAPAGIFQGPMRHRTEMGLIRRELNKSRGHVSIRALVQRAGRALVALKPCWMMSPLSIARYVPPGSLTFDVVVMDEASQLRPEECLGAVARAKQVIVVGDPKQLPPTRFFDTVAADTFSEGAAEPDDETLLDDVESVLDLGLQTWGYGRRLLWHYRSQHEDLIRFSNRHFYQNSLTVFPSPSPRVESLGVRLVPVDGATFHHGVNPVEAEAVADAVFRHLAERPKESLGVVAFNGRQRDLISTCIEARLAREPNLLGMFETFQSDEASGEPFFVKNLENVQGDERDVILISGTYGPDPETGKVYQRFGPITQDRGWRRLNVIFTRARRQLQLFASFPPEAIRLTDKTSEGARIFRAYLEYARDARALAVDRFQKQQAASAFQQALVSHLSELGYQSHLDVGVAGCFVDVAVLHPEGEGEYLLGIVSDGPHHHRAACARDRDRLRHEVLTRLGWRLYSIVSSDWYKARARNLQLLARALETARSATL